MQYLILLLMGTTLVLSEDTCDVEEYGVFSSLLEEWATSAPQNGRQGRIMALPPTKGYYVSDGLDQGLVPPPPVRRYDEWHSMTPPPGPGKIVNRPQKPYNDNFKPSYPPPQPPKPTRPPSTPGSGGGVTNTIDRVDEKPPRKEVSETDLQLLAAIEKLVYRVDLMEKRLRKMEENVHRLVLGQNKAPAAEPCEGNFTRIGSACYHFSQEPLDWKTSNLACRKLRGHLVEFDEEGERKQVLTAMRHMQYWKEADFWTGGLNPGLLWIWSHSARPLFNNTAGGNATQSGGGAVAGEGRCLAVLYEPVLRTHVYRGQDCAYRHRFICEKQDAKTKLSNEIERVSRTLRPLVEIAADTARKAKIHWTLDDQTTNDKQ